jgi:archaellum component FlaC
MTEAAERLDKVEVRLGNIEHQVVELRTDVNGLRADVNALRTDVDKLRILGEENTQQIRLIAEVQSQHGTVLRQLVSDVEPLKALPDLLRTVIRDHERRITALENRP